MVWRGKRRLGIHQVHLVNYIDPKGQVWENDCSEGPLVVCQYPDLPTLLPLLVVGESVWVTKEWEAVMEVVKVPLLGKFGHSSWEEQEQEGPASFCEVLV